MGLFGETVALDPHLESAFIPPPNPDEKRARKRLANEQNFILSLLHAGSESLLVVATDVWSPEIMVVTSERILMVKRGKLVKQLAYSEVAETTIGSFSNRMLVQIETHRSRLDYTPQDSRRFEHVLQIQVATPRIAQALCQEIDRLAGL